MLTNLIQDFLNKNIGELKEKNILLTLPNKRIIKLGEHQESIEIVFNSWLGMWLIFRRGALGLTEGYINNYWHTENIIELMDYLPKNLKAFSKISNGMFSLRFIAKVNHFLNKNTLKGSKKNIEAHYDLGNDFYNLWLDKTMTYSSGIFYEETASLNEAQENKYQSILDMLDLKEGARILEIGCGWGGFLEYAANQGFDVKGITISPSQYQFAEKRLEGMGAAAEIELVDYREVSGKFDAIVSIEMFEAVGSEYWDIFFSKIYSLLKEDGRAAIQTITIGDEFFESYQSNPDFIQTYIFPGGMLASDKVIHELANNNELKLLDQKDFPESYAKTLEKWFINFQECWHKVNLQGFDKNFKNTWDMYLAYCRGGFLNGRISVTQYLMEKK